MVLWSCSRSRPSTGHFRHDESEAESKLSTDDGNKTASCAVSVSGTVSIEQISAEYHIYSERGAIVIDPVRPISIRIFAVTGARIYRGPVLGATRIPVASGIYLVEVTCFIERPLGTSGSGGLLFIYSFFLLF